MLDVNINGVHFCYQVAAKQMIKQGNCTKENPGKLIAVRYHPAILRSDGDADFRCHVEKASSIVGYKAFALLGHVSTPVTRTPVPFCQVSIGLLQ